MSKVGTEIYTCGTAEGIVMVDILIYFTKTRGFYAKVNKDLAKHMPQLASLSADSYEKMAKKAQEVCDKFYQTDLQQKKVILYYYQRNGMNAWRGRNPRPDQIPRFLPASHDENITTGKLAYCIRWMVTIGEKQYITLKEIASPTELSEASKYHWSDDGGYSHREWMGWLALDHTDEREAWFKRTIETYEQLLVKIEEFFGKDSVALLANLEISNFLGLLPGSPLPEEQPHQR